MEQNGVVNGAVNGVGQSTFSLAPGDGRIKEAPHVNGSVAADPNVKVMDYKTDFPELGNGAAAAPAAPTWGNKIAGVPKIRSTNISQVIHLPPEERQAYSSGQRTFGSSLGAEQDKCNEIAKLTHTTIQLSEGRDGTLTVMLNGTRENIERAKNRIVTALQQQASREISVPKEHHRSIIGREGKKLQQLEQETNCHINIPRPNQASDIIVITGPKEGIELAAQRIIQLSDAESKRASQSLVVEKEYWPWIRGARNATMDALQQAYNVRINIPPQSANNNVIVVAGEKEGVAAVAQKINQIHQKMKANAKKMEVSIPKPQHRLIIGPRGEGLADILDKTNVSVEVPPEETNSSMVTLRGETSAIALALPLVYQKATSLVTRELKCPLWLHRHIIGVKGAGIKDITEHYPNAHVDFHSDKEAIVIHGPPDEVKPVEEKLADLTATMIRDMAIEIVKVPSAHHRHIVGKKGAVVNGLKDKYGVQITMPHNDSTSDEIKVEGPRDGVKQAAKEICELGDRLENERTKDLIIEQRFHRLLIGQGGKNVSELRAKFPGVQLEFPEQGRKSDIVQVRGPKDAVESCAKHVQKLVKTMQEESHSEKVPIFKEFHRAIIGKGGQNVKRIREETGCRIDLPNENSGETAITVTGREQNVKKAIAELKKIEAELAQIETKEITIAHKLHARMLGGGGRMIADIAQECGGVHIKFADAKKQSDKVTIRGPADDVAKAEKLLLDLAKDRELSSHEDSLKFKPELRRFLIGRQGGGLRKLREQFPDVRVIVPRDGDDDLETIHLIGKEDEVNKAKEELVKTLKALEETTEITVAVDPQFHRHFVIRNALVLREIQDETGGCVISFPKQNSNSDQVTIKGARDMVEEAKSKIQTIVDDLQHQTTQYMSVPAQFHRTLLTRKSHAIQDIQRDCRVQIQFPQRNTVDSGDNSATGGIPAPDAVQLTGRAEQIDKARAAITDLLPIEVEVPVPYAMHRALIGRGGAEIRAFQDAHGVNLKIPQQEEHKDVVYLSGTPAEIESARAELEEKVREHSAAQFTVALDVPVEFHSKIIGPRGANITQYRNKYGVNVNVPKANEANNNQETITIQGLESKALECKADIEKFISDLQSMHREDIHVAPPAHPRIIGKGGKTLAKIQDDYKVEIRMPRSDEEDPSLVIVMGKDAETVLDAIDHIKNIEEEFMQDYVERFQYEKPPEPPKQARAQPQQVRISNAPWNVNSTDDFPTMGLGDAQPQAAGAWGRPR